MCVACRKSAVLLFSPGGGVIRRVRGRMADAASESDSDSDRSVTPPNEPDSDSDSDAGVVQSTPIVPHDENAMVFTAQFTLDLFFDPFSVDIVEEDPQMNAMDEFSEEKNIEIIVGIMKELLREYDDGHSVAHDKHAFVALCVRIDTILARPQPGGLRNIVLRGLAGPLDILRSYMTRHFARMNALMYEIHAARELTQAQSDEIDKIDYMYTHILHVVRGVSARSHRGMVYMLTTVPPHWEIWDVWISRIMQRMNINLFWWLFTVRHLHSVRVAIRPLLLQRCILPHRKLGTFLRNHEYTNLVREVMTPLKTACTQNIVYGAHKSVDAPRSWHDTSWSIMCPNMRVLFIGAALNTLSFVPPGRSHDAILATYITRLAVNMGKLAPPLLGILSFARIRYADDTRDEDMEYAYDMGF